MTPAEQEGDVNRSNDEPDLPAPPWRVLAKVKQFPLSYWWGHCGDEWWSDGIGMYAHPHELTVLDHPRNDPEAVEIIRKAKEQKQ